MSLQTVFLASFLGALMNSLLWIAAFATHQHVKRTRDDFAEDFAPGVQPAAPIAVATMLPNPPIPWFESKAPAELAIVVDASGYITEVFPAHLRPNVLGPLPGRVHVYARVP